MAPLLVTFLSTFIISIIIQLSSSSLCGNLVINCNKGESNCYSGPCASFAPYFAGHNHLPKALHTNSPTNAPTAAPTKLPTPRFMPYNRVLPYNRLPNSISTHEYVANPSEFTVNSLPTNYYNRIPSIDANNPSFKPTPTPLLYPASNPIISSIANVAISTTTKPTFTPTKRPTSDPTKKPTPNPTLKPTAKPTSRPIAIVNQAQYADSESSSDEDVMLFFSQKQPVSAIINDETSCSIPGERCSSMVPREERCCGNEIGGSTRCKYTARDSSGYYVGFCCVKYGQIGCKYDEDCCRTIDACVDSVCKSNTNIGQGVQTFDENVDSLGLLKKHRANESEKRSMWFPTNIYFVLILMLILPVLYCVWYKYYLAKQLAICDDEPTDVERSYLMAENDADDENDFE